MMLLYIHIVRCVATKCINRILKYYYIHIRNSEFFRTRKRS